MGGKTKAECCPNCKRYGCRKYAERSAGPNRPYLSYWRCQYCHSVFPWDQAILSANQRGLLVDTLYANSKIDEPGKKGGEKC